MSKASESFTGKKAAQVTANLTGPGGGISAWKAGEEEIGIACGFVKFYAHKIDALALARWILDTFGEPDAR